MTKGYHRALTVGLTTVLCYMHPTIDLAQGPSHSIERIIENFITLDTAGHQEKVFVHTDKTTYLTGETIWFKAYCVQASTHQLSSRSKALNIDMIDNQGKAVEQIRIQLTGGVGRGQIFVGPKLVTGHYSLRAYTSWMRNLDTDLVFQKILTIINSSTPEEGEDPVVNSNELIIDFFPEGGDLVYGIESKVAIKVTDSAGSGKQVTGVIYDNNQNKVLDFFTSEYGLSSFFLSPEIGRSYIASVIEDPGSELRVNLPIPKSAGLVMAVKPAEESTFDVTVMSKGQPEEQVYLIVHTRGKLALIEDQRLTKGSAHFSIPEGSLAEGISHVTLMNNLFVPVCERLIFKFPDKGALLQLGTNKPSYANREKVILSVNADQLVADSVPTNLSLSVYKYDENLKSGNGSIVSSLLLSSDLKGPIENPDFFFETGHESELDLLLLTHGWRRFLWSDILAGEAAQARYMPEFISPVVAGKVVSDRVRRQLESVFLGFAGRFPSLNSVHLNSDGSFYFEVPTGIRDQRMFFWSRVDTLEDHEVQLESSFLLPVAAGMKRNPREPKLNEYIEHGNSNIQISHVYLKQTQITGITQTAIEVIKPFYDTPDFHYKLDDYTRFEVMSDIFIEYIGSVMIRREESKNYFHVMRQGRTGLRALDLEALVLLDGVPFNDADFMLEFDPLKVDEVDVINKFYLIGHEIFDGIVNFRTYAGDLAGTPFPSNILEKVYVGLQSPREFFSPDYSTETNRQNRIPDFRLSLYWKPDITLGPSGTIDVEFFTSDDAGNYRIELQGIGSDGTPLSAESEFKVGI